MASAYNYTFDNLSRLGDDVCYQTEKNRQNTDFGNYNLTNYFTQHCGLKKPLELATSQPNVFIRDGYGPGGAGGCNIDSDSNLRIGTIQTNPKSKISLYTRPFLTVPYLGRGPARPLEEARLQQGDHIRNKRSCSTVTETSYIDYRQYPLIPSIKGSVTNPDNLIEGVAAKGWIRGGLPSRDLIRDQDYAQKHVPMN